MSKNTVSNTRAGIAGVVGAVVAFGIAELVHGLYPSVPSILVSIAQRIVELTPGGLVTAGIELLGKADIPVLIAGSAVTGLLVRVASPSTLAPPTKEEASLMAEPGSPASPIMRSREAGS